MIKNLENNQDSQVTNIAIYRGQVIYIHVFLLIVLQSNLQYNCSIIKKRIQYINIELYLYMGKNGNTEGS